MRTGERASLGQTFLDPTGPILYPPVSIPPGTPVVDVELRTPYGHTPSGFFQLSKPAGVVSFDSPEAEKEFFRRYPFSNVKVIRDFEGLGDLPSAADIVGFIVIGGASVFALYLLWQLIKMPPERFWKIQRRHKEWL